MIGISNKLKEMNVKIRILKKSSIAGFVLLILSLFCITDVTIVKEYWIGIWASGQQLTERRNNPPAPGLSNNTLRQEVNKWIRTSGKFDAVIDFDPVVSDPADPNKIKKEYLFQNDYLHFNVAGYQAMADAIDLNLFKQVKAVTY